MKRREFIGLLAGAATAWPLGARAQQNDHVRRIGFLMPSAETDTNAQSRVAAFREGLQQLGWMPAFGRSHSASRCASRQCLRGPNCSMAEDRAAVFGDRLAELDAVAQRGDLRHLLRAYASYYNATRAHRSLDKDAPVHRPVQLVGGLQSRPILGGLHHQYVRI